MEERELRALLRKVAAGETDVDTAVADLKVAPFEELGYAKVDTQRGIRQGVSEVVYGEGKTSGQIAGICRAMRNAGQDRILITRLDEDKAAALQEEGIALDYHPLARVGIVGGKPAPDGNGTIVVAAAGTSDLYAAEEAALTAEMLGNQVERLYDVGVAGIHRLLSHARDIAEANVVIAVAGMEGALASVVGGMASCPVIAVPTSVGYGASFGGVAALLAMLNSCASGVSVVNIDNGFGAGYQAHLINHAKTSPAAQAASTRENEGRRKGDDGRRSMNALHLDLTKSARRQDILADVMGRLDAQARLEVEHALEACGVDDRHHHDLGEVDAAIDNANVSDTVKAHAHVIYRILAEAEAHVHGCAVEHTHFHEVGNGEAVRNVLGICMAIEALAPAKITATAVQTGQGKVTCAHGVLDIPAPATAAIIERGIPTCAERLEGELCTPTSAAVILHYVEDFVV